MNNVTKALNIFVLFILFNINIQHVVQAGNMEAQQDTSQTVQPVDEHSQACAETIPSDDQVSIEQIDSSDTELESLAEDLEDNLEIEEDSVFHESDELPKPEFTEPSTLFVYMRKYGIKVLSFLIHIKEKVWSTSA